MLGEGVRVGVDIEDGDPPDDLPGVARLVLSEREAATLATLPPPRRPTAFLSWWVRKEAVLKALGTWFLTDPRTLDASSPGSIMAGGIRWWCTDLRYDPILRALGSQAPAALAVEHEIPSNPPQTLCFSLQLLLKSFSLGRVLWEIWRGPNGSRPS